MAALALFEPYTGVAEPRPAYDLHVGATVPQANQFGHSLLWCITDYLDVDSNSWMKHGVGMIDQTDDRLEYIPLDVASKPKNGVLECLVDYWWNVHPEKGLILFHSERPRNGRWRYRGSPQGNRNEALARDLGGKLYPWAEVRQVPLVFLPHDCNDYVQ